MSLWVFRGSAACRSLCSSRLVSRRAGTHYLQSTLSSAAGCRQDPEASTSDEPWTGPYHVVASTSDSLDPTRLDRYLASIRVADSEPTLDDVERHKPKGFSPPGSSRYVMEYTNLLETLCRSFSKEQLRRFTEFYKLDPIWTRSSRRKTEYAESIIEKAWGWPSLKEIERKRRDTTEVVVKSFTFTPSQLFLIMGKDGADLLQLSMQHNVHVSLTFGPLALRVEGLRGSLKGLTEHISSLKKGIIDETFELPTGRPIRPDLLQRVSRLSGAYVENHGNKGKVRICAKNRADMTAAERLALRASLEVGTRSRTLCYDPPSKTSNSPVEISETHGYSIYPFVTPCPFPWTMHTNGTFRLRRVADWLGADSYEDIVSTGGLACNSHSLLSLDQSGGDLSRLVCPTTPEGSVYHRRNITAVFGHILMPSGGNPQQTTILPPLRGTLSLPDILKWVEASGTPLTFVPSLPSPMMTVAIGKRRILHRLVYRTLPEVACQTSKLPQQVLKFEIELPGPSSTDTRAESTLKPKDIPSSDESSSSTDPLSFQESDSQSDGLLQANNIWAFNCQVGREAYVNLMLPDRPVDVQLCTFDWDGITSMRQPQVLREYAAQLRKFLTNMAQLSQPNPPSTLNYEGRAYYLHDSLSLRQSNNPILLSAIPSGCHMDNLVEVCSENIMDLQSNQKMELCQVKFDGTIEGQSWDHFLAACDKLSVASLASRNGQDEAETTFLHK